MRIGFLFGMIVILLSGCNVSQEVLPAATDPTPIQMHAFNAAAYNELPPAKYRIPTSAIVVYIDEVKLDDVCGVPNTAACTLKSKDVIFMPVKCSPVLVETTQVEYIEPEVLLTQKHDFCTLTKVHEVGHVNGWSGYHEDSVVFAVEEDSVSL